jgi:membrane-associated phospholipid phosphatase
VSIERAPATPARVVARAIAGAVLGTVVVMALGITVSAGMTDAFDRAVIEAVRAPELRTLLSPLHAITELGSTWAVTAIAIVVLVVGVGLGRWVEGLAGAFLIAVAALANSVLKTSIARARPDLLEPIVVERGFSFPSGHAALSTVAYGIVAVLVSRSGLPPAARWAIVIGLAVLVVLIGLSRVWLGVHYPTDVLAGWAAGATIVLVYAALTRPASPAPAAEAADAGPAAPRSGPPAAG